jgi:hypothetical protein
MDRVLFFLDGITFQKAGELFFETEATLEEQQICPFSYRRCIEDLAETLIFGKALAIGRDLPEVAPGVLPGDYLRSYIGQLARPIDNAGDGGKPDDLLSDPAGKAEAVGFIHQLSDIVTSPEFVFWRELAIRESRHIGDDPSLKTQHENPDDYRYTKRFNQNPELRSAAPREYLREIIRTVRDTGMVDNLVCDDALQVFFAENAATHLLTFCWYRKVIPNTLGDYLSLYQPHATRSAMIPARADSYRVELPVEGLPPRTRRTIRRSLRILCTRRGDKSPEGHQ